MNYIKQLEADKAELKLQLEEIDRTIYELKAYLLSDKFKGECALACYVNIKDVLLRLQEN